MKRLVLFVGIVLLSLIVIGCSTPPSESPSSSAEGWLSGDNPSPSIAPSPSSPAPSVTSASPTPKNYTVLIQSKPSGARVWLNGNDTGENTPFTFTAEPGEHTVVLKLDGYQDFEDRIRNPLGDSSITKTETLQKLEETMEAYKARAQTIEYRVLEKTPDKYKGVILTYTGHVVQIIEDAGVTFMRVEVTQGDYDIWSDVVGVIYMGSLDVYDEDIVTFWGPGSGTYEYESQAGWNISIPSVLAKYVEK